MSTLFEVRLARSSRSAVLFVRGRTGPELKNNEIGKAEQAGQVRWAGLGSGRRAGWAGRAGWTGWAGWAGGRERPRRVGKLIDIDAVPNAHAV